MEEYANESCSIVYLCTSSQNDVYELYDKKSPPSPTSDPAQSPKTPNRIRENVRALLDEDQGAFDEGGHKTIALCPGMWVLTVSSVRELAS